MSEYHKIQTLWLRNPATNYKTLLEGEWAWPEFAYLAGLEWLWTEKVDGTNIRVIWDGERVRFGGKTDNASLPAPLVTHLTETFTAERVAAVAKGPLVLYGEGYGGKIQKGSRYGAQSFILFDVRAGDVWLERDAVAEIATALNVPLVPVVGRGTLAEAAEFARTGFTSRIALDPTLVSEGLVMRPVVELLSRRGHRIISKVKHTDFAAEIDRLQREATQGGSA